MKYDLILSELSDFNRRLGKLEARLDSKEMNQSTLKPKKPKMTVYILKLSKWETFKHTASYNRDMERMCDYKIENVSYNDIAKFIKAFENNELSPYLDYLAIGIEEV